MAEPGFVARPARRQALVVLAILMPILVFGAIGLPLHPEAPAVMRGIGLLILLPLAAWAVQCLRALLDQRPLIALDAEGLLWRRWSGQRIPWSAFGPWQERGIGFGPMLCFWLARPADHPPGMLQGLLRPANRWLGFGDIALSAAGTDRRFEELAAALRRFAPPPPLPADPALARRVLKARARQARRGGGQA
ncbi:hypothetical protein [Roseomonas sp. 18066]|uniref:hypothetical protein n=1 Tax=Roseomonas sp. 18066 TaxID=2681412 RepID=UPI001356BB7C|nr:hypothetical protein [Roseomonas sp. 18066]